MNIEELNLEYKNKMDKLLEEYKEKAKELVREEEPFIKYGQEYYFIDGSGKVCNNSWSNHPIDQERLDFGNCFPYKEENKEKVYKEVKLITERKKLQNQMEQFARQNNDGEIDWSDSYEKWYLYLDCKKSQIGIDIAYDYRIFNSVYFTSAEVAEQALIKFEDRIRKLYLDVEE